MANSTAGVIIAKSSVKFCALKIGERTVIEDAARIVIGPDLFAPGSQACPKARFFDVLVTNDHCGRGHRDGIGCDVMRAWRREDRRKRIDATEYECNSYRNMLGPSKPPQFRSLSLDERNAGSVCLGSLARAPSARR